MIWSEYLTSIADAMGVTAIQAGVMISLIFSTALILTVLIATKGRKPEVSVPFVALFSTVLFTFMGWYPVWIGSVMALVISILLARIISGGF